MWILIISVIINSIIMLIVIKELQNAVLNAVKIQDKQNEIFARNILEIHREIKSKEEKNKKVRGGTNE